MANTTTAVAGVFQQRNGAADFLQYENSTGTVVYSINSTGTPTTVGGLVTVGQGLSPEVAAVAIANTTTTIGSTVLLASAPAGTYRVSATINVTTAGTNAAPSVQVLYSNLAITNQTQAVATIGVTAATAVAGGVTVFNTTTAANINYQVTGVTTSGSLGYNAEIVLERLV